MRIFEKVFRGAMALSLIFVMVGLISPINAHAATSPSLGTANSYAVFGKAGVTNSGAPTHIWGNVGADSMVNITGLTAPQVDGSIIAPASGIQTAVTAAYGALDAWGADSGITLSGTVVVTPGVYTVGAALLNGTVTLSGAGVYILRSSSSITTDPGAQVVLINGANPCNVFWEVADSFAIGSGAHIEGTIITNTSFISLGTNASLVGRAFSSVAQVTLLSNLITNPCAAAPVSERQPATINVVKTVINDNSGKKVVSDFPLFVNGAPVISGATNTFTTVGGFVYTVTETNDPNYTRTFSGDCDVNGQLNLNPGENKFCIVTNNDIGAPVVPLAPPLIDVVKTASPLSLPNGPGSVTYTYTLRNIGTVPVTNVTMVGDTCSPIVLASGDTNGNHILDLNETWVHTCSTNLSQTHTNTVVATGWANGISATDIASATVVVGAPIVPPLIHVVKRPNIFTLRAGGGPVTYTYTVTNPGTAPLSNVIITDDKCTGLPGRVVGHPGDLNKNDLLESNESWSFACQSNLTQTTTNTATATGSANGLTARDFALATVVVAMPKLPNTGLPQAAPWNSAVFGGIILLGLISLVVMMRKRTF